MTLLNISSRLLAYYINAFRDIKPSNILLFAAPEMSTVEWTSINTEFLTLKLADFGHSRTYGGSEDEKTMSVVGTPSFSAPEIVQGMRQGLDRVRYGFKVDLWSAGMVAHVMHTGELASESAFQGKAIFYLMYRKVPVRFLTYFQIYQTLNCLR